MLLTNIPSPSTTLGAGSTGRGEAGDRHFLPTFRPYETAQALTNPNFKFCAFIPELSASLSGQASTSSRGKACAP
jgi:hypothetical protein